jgi:hypothetical protein
MKKSIKLWVALGAGVTAGVMTANGAFASGEHQHGQGEVLIAQAGEAGESGGEGGGSEADASTDDAVLIDVLGQVEGHLRAANELYGLGAIEQAKTHVKHPEDELYADLVPAFEKRGMAGFAVELSAMAKLIETGAPTADVTAALTGVIAQIDAQSSGLRTAKETAEAVHSLVRTAAAEYAVGVKDAAVTDAHEFQDAWGFVQAAKRLVASLPDSERAAHAAAFDEMAAQLASLDPAWADLTGATGTKVDPVDLAVAAARIEIAGLSIK